MKILLTGGAGYIGSNTAAALLDAGHQVVLIDNFINSSVQIVNCIEKSAGASVKCHRVDVTDINAVRQIFSSYYFDAVMHFAARKAVGESVAKPIEYYRNNLDGLLTLLEVMKEFQVKNLIYSSSATVYGSQSPAPFSENMPLGTCTNPYGWTKWMSEQILRDAALADKELSIMLLRYFNPIGGHESGLLGERPHGVPNNLMPYIVQTAEGKRDKLHIFGDDYPTPDGTCIRDYIHVTDIAEGHVAALRYCIKHTGVETVNLGTGRGTSVLELVHTFERVNHLSLPYEVEGRRPGDIAECWAAVEKADRLLGWRAQKSLEDMCRDSWNSRETGN